MKKKMPLASVIIVNYNGKAFLRDCFNSLYNLDYPKNKLEIIMVDNGSSDGSLDYVKKQFPTVKIIINNENNYAKANNLGIKAAQGRYIGLINNDIKVDKEWLVELVKTIEADDKIGAVGSKILFMDGTLQSVGHHEYPGFYWGDIGFREEDKRQYDSKQEVVSICGCSVLYRKECLGQVGYLDEDFNMFMEDVDMGIRCRKKGWKSVTCPGSIIYHKSHGTIGNEDNARHWQEVNRLLLIAKHWPEKLADALAGRGHFIIKNNIDSARDVSEVIAKVSNKILKEHGWDMLDKLSPGLFTSVRNIYNFEKDHLVQEVKDKNEELSLKGRQLASLEQNIASLQQEMASLIQQKDQEIAAKNEELSLKGRQLVSLEQNIASLQQEMASFIQQKEFELNNNKLQLGQARKELSDIYTSTGYRYILKPLWDFLWRVKASLRPVKRKIISLRKLSQTLKEKNRDLRKIFSRFPAKFTEIYLGLVYRNNWPAVYANHIKCKTCPPLPEKLTLMIIRKCNLRCRFCDIPGVNKSEMILSRESSFKAISAAKKIGVKWLVLTGGEPFLHPNLFEIINFAYSKDIKVAVTTNGLFIKQYLGEIKKSNIDCISVSIDGKEQTHDFLRGFPSAYKIAMEGIESLINNKVNTFINFVITNRNIHELNDMHNIFSKMGVKRVFFLPVINKPEFFPSSPEERFIYMAFIKRLKRIKYISDVEYKYLKNIMNACLCKKNIRTRCLGLNAEFGVDVNGDISPCCIWENRKNELNDLGNILNEDIEDLWYSRRFYEARYSIFAKGCLNCFNPSLIELPRKTKISFLIPSQVKAIAGSRKRDQAIERIIEKPKHVHMRFTNKCNLTCRHCDIWKKKKGSEDELAVEEWKACIDKLFIWLGVFKLDLAGGEILLYPGVIPLIEYCAGKGISINLTTNATLINEALAAKIINSGLYCINLSTDGLYDVHGYIRNKPDAFLKTQEAAYNLLGYRKKHTPYISTTTVITKQNLNQLTEIINLPQKWGINSSGFQVLDNNFGSEYTTEWFRHNEFWPDDFLQVEKAIDGLIAAKKAGMCINNSLEQLNAMKRYYRNPEELSGQECLSGNNNFIVNESGKVMLCWNMPVVGDILKEDPERIWNGNKAYCIRQQIKQCRRTCRMLNCNYI